MSSATTRTKVVRCFAVLVLSLSKLVHGAMQCTAELRLTN